MQYTKTVMRKVVFAWYLQDHLIFILNYLYFTAVCNINNFWSTVEGQMCK